MLSYDKEDLERVEDLENDVKPGEILHCQVHYSYKINTKVYKEKANEAILKRPYEKSNWPKLENTHRFVLRQLRNNKKLHEIEDFTILEIYIITRAGFANPPK